MIVESVIKCRLNAELIAAVARLWIRPTDLVLDVTYGRGHFWTAYRPERLIAHDLAVDGIDFRALPEADGVADVVAFDPPYIAQGGRSTTTAKIPAFLARHGLLDGPRTTSAVQDLTAAGILEAARVLAPGGRLLVKCMDYVNGGVYVQGRHHVVLSAEAAGLRQVDEFVHHSGTGPQPPRPRQLHSRRSHSFLCVFMAPRKRSATSEPARAPAW